MKVVVLWKPGSHAMCLHRHDGHGNPVVVVISGNVCGDDFVVGLVMTCVVMIVCVVKMTLL